MSGGKDGCGWLGKWPLYRGWGQGVGVHCTDAVDHRRRVLEEGGVTTDGMTIRLREELNKVRRNVLSRSAGMKAVLYALCVLVCSDLTQATTTFSKYPPC